MRVLWPFPTHSPVPTAALPRIAAARDLGRHASAVVLDALRVLAGALLAGALAAAVPTLMYGSADGPSAAAATEEGAPAVASPARRGIRAVVRRRSGASSEPHVARGRPQRCMGGRRARRVGRPLEVVGRGPAPPRAPPLPDAELPLEVGAPRLRARLATGRTGSGAARLPPNTRTCPRSTKRAELRTMRPLTLPPTGPPRPRGQRDRCRRQPAGRPDARALWRRPR